jgi:hypothetical protein
MHQLMLTTTQAFANECRARASSPSRRCPSSLRLRLHQTTWNVSHGLGRGTGGDQFDDSKVLFYYYFHIHTALPFHSTHSAPSSSAATAFVPCGRLLLCRKYVISFIPNLNISISCEQHATEDRWMPWLPM